MEKYDLYNPDHIEQFLAELNQFLLTKLNILPIPVQDGVTAQFVLLVDVSDPDTGKRGVQTFDSCDLGATGLTVHDVLQATRGLDPEEFDKHLFNRAITLLRDNDMGTFASLLREVRGTI